MGKVNRTDVRREAVPTGEGAPRCVAKRGEGGLNKSVKLYIMTKTTLDQKSNRNLLKIEQIPAVFPPTYQSNTSVLLLGKIFG